MEEVLNELQQYVRDQIWSRSTTNRDATFALYVSLARQKRNLSRVQLATLANISEAAVIDIEVNNVACAEIAPEVVAAIGKTLGISYEKFVQLNQHVLDELSALSTHEDGVSGLAGRIPHLCVANSAKPDRERQAHITLRGRGKFIHKPASISCHLEQIAEPLLPEEDLKEAKAKQVSN